MWTTVMVIASISAISQAIFQASNITTNVLDYASTVVLTAETNTSTTVAPATVAIIPSVTVEKNRSAYPEWYLVNIADPFSLVDFRIGQQFKWFADANGSISVRNPSTGKSVDWRERCVLLTSHSQYFAASMFYKAFYGYDNWVVYSYSRVSLLFSYISLFLFFIPLGMIGISTLVLRRLSRKDKLAHVYVYYNAINAMNTAIYCVTILECTGLLRFIELPLCYTGVWVAMNFAGFSGNIYPTILDCFYGTSCLIQAILAFDRFMAMYSPVHFRKHFNRRSALLMVLGVVGLGVFGLLFQNFSSGYAQLNSCACTKQNELLSKVGKSLPGILLGMSLAFQLIFCTAVFVKILARKSVQLKVVQGGGHRKRERAAYGAAKFSMLLGTCILNAVGATFVLGYHYNSDALIAPANSTNAEFFKRTLLYIVTLSSTAGLFMHCTCCKQYRKQALHLILTGIERLIRVEIELKAKLLSGNTIAPAATSFVNPRGQERVSVIPPPHPHLAFVNSLAVGYHA